MISQASSALGRLRKKLKVWGRQLALCGATHDQVLPLMERQALSSATTCACFVQRRIFVWMGGHPVDATHPCISRAHD